MQENRTYIPHPPSSEEVSNYLQRVNDPIHDQIQVLTNQKAGSASTFAFTATMVRKSPFYIQHILHVRPTTRPPSKTFNACFVPRLLASVLGTATWHLTRSASLVSQALRSSGGGISLPHNTFRDTTFSSSRPPTTSAHCKRSDISDNLLSSCHTLI